ncbi:(2Fe-2S)-binding protein [Shewanella corallii]|uniref:Bacterioferritin-associated ferredoxin n=1 Tax=Shewanella corallii TaxID=560080 RepID=A0ABT0N7G7_9GAMM|nr:(2Fe-2S)-binding protein [Shewanella corallii]MCL2914391.1 (2Fe-2S)-binding protein [Shewanella corallii]
MYVCVCHGVTESQVKQALAEGVTGMAELRLKLGMGGSCGKCLKQTGQMIKAEANAKANYYEVA